MTENKTSVPVVKVSNIDDVMSLFSVVNPVTIFTNKTSFNTIVT